MSSRANEQITPIYWPLFVLEYPILNEANIYRYNYILLGLCPRLGSLAKLTWIQLPP